MYRLYVLISVIITTYHILPSKRLHLPPVVMNRFLVLALAFTGAIASALSRRQLVETDARTFIRHINAVCSPFEDSGQPDWNVPCNALTAIHYECQFGSGGRDLVPTRQDIERFLAGEAVSSGREVPDLLPYEAQRVCICQSQYRHFLRGCMKCLEAHGGGEDAHPASESGFEQILSKYCDVAIPATGNYMDIYTGSIVQNAPNPSTIRTTTYSDPIGNVTDVSLYFTPSVTGTSAYLPAVPTAQSSGGNVTYTSTRISGGQIVPTEVAIDESAASSVAVDEEEATASSDGGAVQTAISRSGAIGALGLAALFAAFRGA